MSTKCLHFLIPFSLSPSVHIFIHSSSQHQSHTILGNQPKNFFFHLQQFSASSSHSFRSAVKLVKASSKCTFLTFSAASLPKATTHRTSYDHISSCHYKWTVQVINAHGGVAHRGLSVPPAQAQDSLWASWRVLMFPLSSLAHPSKALCPYSHCQHFMRGASPSTNQPYRCYTYS